MLSDGLHVVGFEWPQRDELHESSAHCRRRKAWLGPGYPAEPPPERFDAIPVEQCLRREHAFHCTKSLDLGPGALGAPSLYMNMLR